MRHSFCLFVANFASLLTIPTVPPYCLVYPIQFTKDTPQDERDHLHPDQVLPGLCTRECVCCQTIHHTNMTLDHYTTYIGSCLLVLQGTQYNEDGLPKVIKLCNHHGP